jgi:hypothetical protein
MFLNNVLSRGPAAFSRISLVSSDFDFARGYIHASDRRQNPRSVLVAAGLTFGH